MITGLIGWCKGKMNYSSNKHQISLTLGIDLDSLQSPMKPTLLKNNNTTDDQNLEKSLFPFLSKQGVFSHCRKIAHHSNFSGIISQHCYVALKMTLVKSEKSKRNCTILEFLGCQKEWLAVKNLGIFSIQGKFLSQKSIQHC